MTERNNGGPAFPQRVVIGPDVHFAVPCHIENDGMTLRDYFAAALVSSGHTFGPSRSLTPEQVAAQAYQMADAMLEARK